MYTLEGPIHSDLTVPRPHDELATSPAFEPSVRLARANRLAGRGRPDFCTRRASRPESLCPARVPRRKSPADPVEHGAVRDPSVREPVLACSARPAQNGFRRAPAAEAFFRLLRALILSGGPHSGREARNAERTRTVGDLAARPAEHPLGLSCFERRTSAARADVLPSAAPRRAASPADCCSGGSPAAGPGVRQGMGRQCGGLRRAV